MTYICKSCGSEGKRIDGIDSRYPDDYLIECKDCGNWEQVGNNKPYSFMAKEE
jgi:uncharacterized Zn finger protein